jgi:hypothetical protein
MVHSRKVKVQEMNKGWKDIITDDKRLLPAVKNNQVLSTMCQKAVAGVIKVLKVPKHLIQGLFILIGCLKDKPTVVLTR